MKDLVLIHQIPEPEALGAFDQDPTPEYDYHKIDNIQFDQVDYKDAPDFADAYICSAEFNGQPLTEEQLDDLNEDRGFCYLKLFEFLF